MTESELRAALTTGVIENLEHARVIAALPLDVRGLTIVHLNPRMPAYGNQLTSLGAYFRAASTERGATRRIPLRDNLADIMISLSDISQIYPFFSLKTAAEGALRKVKPGGALIMLPF